MRAIRLLHPSVASLCLLAALAEGLPIASAAVQFTDVFVGGAEGAGGTANYRIPALIVAPNGDLVAIAEGRPTPNDPGEILGALNRLVSKVSTNGGASWSPLNVVEFSTQFNYSDPRPYVDAATNMLFVQYTQWPDGGDSGNVPPGLGDNSSVAFYRASTDNGQTWNAAVNINAQVKDSTWSQTCNGPGVGVQLRWQTNSARNGRIVVPAFVNLAVPPATRIFREASFYSDDHGISWSRSPVASSGSVDEAQVVELTNGDVLMDARAPSGPRIRFISHDGGATWGSGSAGDIPITPVNAGLIRYSAKRDGDDRDRLLFSAPLGNPAGSGNSRDNLGVWTSYDEGKTFINPVSIDPAVVGGYSALQKLGDGSIAIIYEKTVSTQITVARLGMTDLEGQKLSAHVGEYDGFGNNIDRKRGGIGWSGSWTGTGVPTNSTAAAFGGSSLKYNNAVFLEQSGRLDLSSSHDNLTRKLATAVSLNTNSTTYVSFLVSSALDTSSDGSTNEFLNFEFRDASDVVRARFGVNSSEAFFLDTLGISQATAADALLRPSTYLLMAKIVARDGTAGNFDQIYLKVFQSGVDALPSNEEGMNWTLVGSTTTNSSALLDRIAFSSGSSATWSVDEVRLGDTFSGVLHNTFSTPGDFNSDGLVDAADYVVWRNNLNHATSLPNETITPGQVTQEDYYVWMANFGASPNAAQASSTAVNIPEPSSAKSFVLLALGAIIRWRGGRKNKNEARRTRVEARTSSRCLNVANINP